MLTILRLLHDRREAGVELKQYRSKQAKKKKYWRKSEDDITNVESQSTCDVEKRGDIDREASGD